MSQQELPIAVRLAQTYLDSFDQDPLLDLEDIRQYDEPNFVGKNGKFFLVRCYKCDDTHRGRENYIPSAATGCCAWCGWKPDPEIIAYIYAKMVIEGKADMHELREIKVIPQSMPEKRGMTLEEIAEAYPTQYAYGKRGVCYEPSDTEDDGYPD